jgi:hypothetical protein
VVILSRCSAGERNFRLDGSCDFFITVTFLAVVNLTR